MNQQNSTAKILKLQDELLNLRKQISTKEHQWQKQRSNLLNENDLISMELTDSKHRQNNLVQINQALITAFSQKADNNKGFEQLSELLRRIVGVQAMKQPPNRSNSTKHKESIRKIQKKNDKKLHITYEKQIQTDNYPIGKDDNLIQTLKFERSKLKASNQQYKTILQEQAETIQNQKMKLIELQNQNNELRKNKEDLMKEFDKNMKNNMKKLQGKYERKMHDFISQASKPEISSFREDQQSNNSSFYSKIKANSDYSEHNSTNNYSYFNENSYDYPQYQQEDSGNVLCEVCNKVYPINMFKKHMPKCQQQNKQRHFKEILTLKNKKNAIEQRLNQIKTQQIKNKNYNNQKRKSFHKPSLFQQQQSSRYERNKRQSMQGQLKTIIKQLKNHQTSRVTEQYAQPSYRDQNSYYEYSKNYDYY